MKPGAVAGKALLCSYITQGTVQVLDKRKWHPTASKDMLGIQISPLSP